MLLAGLHNSTGVMKNNQAIPHAAHKATEFVAINYLNTKQWKSLFSFSYVSWTTTKHDHMHQAGSTGLHNGAKHLHNTITLIDIMTQIQSQIPTLYLHIPLSHPSATEHEMACLRIPRCFMARIELGNGTRACRANNSIIKMKIKITKN